MLGIVASPAELPAGGVAWGHGGWVPPAEREALDWLTLGRLLGWSAAAGARPAALALGRRALVVTCDPESLGPDDVARLETRLREECLLVIVRGASSRHPLAALAGARRGTGPDVGRRLAWEGPGGTARFRPAAGIPMQSVDPSPGTEVWATVDGRPALAVRPVGRGAVATLAFHASAARDAAGAATAILRRLLVEGPGAPTAWLDLERTLVLRMDDPGSAQKVHCSTWCYAPLGEQQWAEIATDLRRRRARLSIGYTAGWVDDGDPARGRLVVGGEKPPRRPGAVHPSPRVRYVDLAGHAPGRVSDYEAEFRGIQMIRRAGLGEVELHGHTHLHPDPASWAAAADRHSERGWYRELGRRAQPVIDARPSGQDPVALGVAALQRWFGVRPTTLIPPGDEFSDATVRRALELGFSLFSSYYLALRDGNRFCWCQHVCSPYLNEPDSSWFEAGLPVVGYFHDNEPSTHGVGWLTRCLDDWQAAGAERFLDLRELAAALNRRVDIDDDGATVTVDEPDTLPLVRPLRVALRVPAGVPSIVTVRRGRAEHRLEPFRGLGGYSVIDIPP